MDTEVVAVPLAWFRREIRGVAVVALLLVATGCASSRPRPTPHHAPAAQTLDARQVTQVIPARVKDRKGWAQDVLDALAAHHHDATVTNVCSVLAIIEQESGYQPNPVVPGLSRIVQQRLDAYAGRLGPLGRPMLHALLDGKAPGHKQTFEERLKHVRTERDLDVLFRELMAHYEHKFPRAYAAADLLGGLFASTHIEDLNPITTGGSMQVSVRFATDLGARRGLGHAQVRDALYTREGGVHYGTARLLGYRARYTEPIHRFADYNAGVFASRNAALQHQVAELTGIKIAADGDLLAYDRHGAPRDVDTGSLKALLAYRARFDPALSIRQLRADVRLEKRAELEATATWRSIKRVYEEKKRRKPAYAQVPEVAIRSPKMKKDRSTAWYARNVQLRFDACRKRARRVV